MKTASTSGEAKTLLRAETTSAIALQLAARKLLGSGYTSWEPETIWIELEHQGVELPPVNRDKLQAVITLDLVPSFYWDAVVFEKTALAFNDLRADPEVLDEATPEQLAWAVEEAEHVRSAYGEGPFEFDHEPKVYAATVLHRRGMVLAPPQLKFCQATLDVLVREPGLKGRVEAADVHGPDHPFPETSEGVQLAHLAAIRAYVQERQTRTAQDLAQLG